MVIIYKNGSLTLNSTKHVNWNTLSYQTRCPGCISCNKYSFSFFWTYM